MSDTLIPDVSRPGIKFDFTGYKLIGKFGPQPIYQNGETLLLVCQSSMTGGGITIREDAYNKLKQYADKYDCRVLLVNATSGFEQVVALADLPVKDVMVFPKTGVSGFIVDPDDLVGSDFEPEKF